MTESARPDGMDSPTTDLSYLAPEHLRIGGIGVFAGDWAYTDNGRIPVGFVGTLIDTWNGWAVFTCTREVAEAIVADQGRLRKAERARMEASGERGRNRARAVNEAIVPMWWDGDEIVVDERAIYGEDEGLSRVAPDGDGLYVVNGWRWTWEAVDAAVCDHIAGVIPPDGQQQVFVEFVHTPLRAPHDRLTVTSIKTLTMGGGLATRAVLRLDGRRVGSIDNRGDGSPTEFHSATANFGWQQLREFVDGCRRLGRPVIEELVLDALVTEYELTRQVHRAARKGVSLVRLINDGFTLATYTITGPRIDPADVPAVLADLNRRYSHPAGSVWQIWRASRWAYLGPATLDMGDPPGSPNIG